MRYRPLFCALACFALGALGLPGRAQNEAPEPAPTNAAQSLESRITVEGYGHLPLNDTEPARREAYQAAVLDAYQQLFWQGAEHLGLLPPDMPLDFRSFRVDDQHPNPVLMDWLLRAEPLSQQVSANRLRVTLQSPPLGELSSDFPHFVRTLKQDVDGDAVPETIGVTYDGRVQVLKPVANGGFQLLATTPSLNVFACNVLKTAQKETWEQVQLSRVVSVASLEPLGGGKLRAVADLTLGESVDERWVGKATEQREILLRWDEPKGEPVIEVTEPADFLYTTKAQVPWKGLLRAPAGLSTAKLRVNGRPYWQTPDQFAAQRLRMDILLPLLPGVNRAHVAVTDQSRRTVSREVLMFRDAPSPGLQSKNRRALLIGVPEYLGTQFPRLPRVQQDLDRFRSFLQRPDGGGVPASQITTISGKAATRQKVLETLRQMSKAEGDERVFLLVYFGGLSAAGSGGGKGLLPYDARGFDEGAISTADLLVATGELRQQDVVLLADTTQGSIAVSAADQLWLDSQEFAETLARQGWAVLSSVDGAPQMRDSENGSRLLSAFIEGCGGAADGNRDGFVEWDEAYRHLFQTLRVSSPGTAPPLRRGELLGRVPLSAVPRRTP